MGNTLYTKVQQLNQQTREVFLEHYLIASSSFNQKQIMQHLIFTYE